MRRADVPFAEDVPLARRTYWRVGGPADGFASVDAVDRLSKVANACFETHCDLVVLGNASNVLVSDRGVRGLVIELVGSLADTETEPATEPPVVVAGAGLKLTVLLARAKRHGWTGLECFAGIPGSVGGAVRMNAGSVLGETAEALLGVGVVLRNGSCTEIGAESLRLSYRTCHLPEGAIIASARLRTTRADVQESQERVRLFIERRKATQPLDLPSCGSTFRNPPGDHAGRLVEAAGLKGFSLGGAQVSLKHANFVVNVGNATAADIRRVIAHVEDSVRDQFGVALEREVLMVGDWGEKP